MNPSYCKWHPDVETYIQCNRCDTPVCVDCRRDAPVGFHCRDCMSDARSSVRQIKIRKANVTRVIIGICLAIFLLDEAGSGDLFIQFGVNQIAITEFGEYYRLITAMFIHGSIIHIAFNMLILFQFGSAIEEFIGSARFILLYFAAGIGGSVASFLFNNPFAFSVGASGAIFGLMGAYLMIGRRMNYPTNQVVGLLVINIVLGFVLPNIDWYGHFGGLVVGLAVGAGLNLQKR
ncbi:MAG: rhomboid family intramembrane serine protease [Candidatus Nanopelagicales bacterium]